MRRLLTFLLLLALAPAVAAQTARGEARPWPHESSDIPVDPRIHFGSLPNGLRWAWADHAEPEERCYLRLHVNAGSLAEQDSEQGMAHFLEHLAFNGSRNFAPGTLIEWFQEHGMSFGADTNAHTSFSETVYKLDLPTGDVETLREGLTVMRDFADGLLLEEEEVQAEKGVIDGEQRERDSAGFRMFLQQMERMYAGTRYAERLPIGKKAVRDAFTAESVRAFYTKWYRPEHMTLVLVGDLGGLDPAPLFEEAFGGMVPPPGRPALEPVTGRVASYEHAFSIHEDEIPSVSLTVSVLTPWEDEMPTQAAWVEQLPLQYAHSMLNLRFAELAKDEDAPFLGASVGAGDELTAMHSESLSVQCKPEQWSEALAFCEQELRRALEFGFQQAELDELRADMLRGLDEAVAREATQHSSGILGEVLLAAEERYVPTDAATTRAILRPAIESLTVEQCHAALAEAWDAGPLSITAMGKLDLGEEAGAQLRAALEASRAVPVERMAEIVVDAFAYASSADAPGEVVERRHVEDLDFHMLRFANGVTVNIKKTDFKEKQILIQGNLGEGGLASAPSTETSAVSFFADAAFNGGGLLAHDNEDLRRLTAGRTVGSGLAVGEDRIVVGGSTTAEDLLLQCELMCAWLTAPGWREDGMVQMKRQIPLVFQGMAHQHQGPLLTEFLPAVYGGDPRFGLPAQESLEAVTMEQVRALVDPQLADAPLELSFVGDLDVEEVVAACARTFGKLPPRRALREHAEHRAVPAAQTGLKQLHTVQTQVPKSMVLLLYPATDGRDAATRRTLSFLGTVLNDRLRLEVREKLGAAYSPGAGTQLSEVFPGNGMIMIQAMADPENVDTLVEACLAAADSLATEGVSQEETDRLREPVLNQIRDARRTNGYWLGAIEDAHRDPASIENVRTVTAFYEALDAAALSAMAAEYLGRARADVLVVDPE
jgi:zinc protease